MAGRDERATAAVEKLRWAVNKLPPGSEPLNRLLGGVNWRAVAKAAIVNWVDDAERACVRIGRALDLVDAVGDADEARDVIEGALWRITAAREKLEAVFVLSASASRR